jgi:hypothetical protein
MSAELRLHSIGQVHSVVVELSTAGITVSVYRHDTGEQDGESVICGLDAHQMRALAAHAGACSLSLEAP